ncbi:DNA alkylation repair protein [Candidatus Woesearchaeota archaeon]|nr:DNA alkylation repair protein [Candidatus Woesearchaeota archaeon]
MKKEAQEILRELKKHGSKRNIDGMARFGIDSSSAYGVSMPIIRSIAKKLGKNHELGLELWKHDVHEAKIMSCLVLEPEKLTDKETERFVKGFYSWDLVDQFCLNLLDKLPDARKKAIEWSKREREFEKRTGYALMAVLAVHDKKTGDKGFIKFLPHIARGATDERNFVKKAVNWALRQIGKRSRMLNKEAIQCASRIQKINNRAAKWIANDALRELKSDAVKKRLK